MYTVGEDRREVVAGAQLREYVSQDERRRTRMAIELSRMLMKYAISIAAVGVQSIYLLTLIGAEEAAAMSTRRSGGEHGYTGDSN